MQYIDKIELFLMFFMLLYKDLYIYTDFSVLAYWLLTTVIKIDRDVSIDENWSIMHNASHSLPQPAVQMPQSYKGRHWL